MQLEKGAQSMEGQFFSGSHGRWDSSKIAFSRRSSLPPARDLWGVTICLTVGLGGVVTCDGKEEITAQKGIN